MESSQPIKNKSEQQNYLVSNVVQTEKSLQSQEKQVSNQQLVELRQFLSNYVTDMEFSDSQTTHVQQQQTQQVTFNDWRKIQRLQFCKFDCHLSKIISQLMMNLKQLQLHSCGIEEQGAKVICKEFSRLIELDLSGNSIRQTGGLCIAQSMFELKKLNLQDNKVGDFAIINIAQKLKKLQQADFSNNKVGNLGVSKIASNLKRLRRINIGWNSITTKGAQKLSKLNNLTYLNIKTNSIQTKGAIILARRLSKLIFFRVGNNRLGDYGARLICNTIPALEGLGFWDSYITADSLDSIKKLQKLNWLSIAHNNLTEQDVFNLCGSLPDLRFCDASKIGISEQAKNILQESHPDCVFEFTDTV